MTIEAPTARVAAAPVRLGFLGVGWIGRNRMAALVDGGGVEAAAVADPVDEEAAAALEIAPDARRAGSLDDLLAMDLDGVVIATPSALHAEQSVRALEAGLAVFCQKPLGRDGAEARRVVEAARAADRLLGVDLSYRHTRAARAVRDIVAGGGLGSVYAVDLVFHNAYGPGKAWFKDPARAGGGCVIDLGVHLVDLALWALGFPGVEGVTSRLFTGGRPLTDRTAAVEDYATAQLDLAGGVTARLACSWHLPAGRDAVIEAVFYGTDGGVALRNVDGSFYDLVAERYDGRVTERLVSPPDAWGGRAAVDWARRLATGGGYDPAVERVADVADVLDRIYRGT